ncbi:MAG TPA: SH3 domain-containing protein [Bryobacteraceae bacterium]
MFRSGFPALGLLSLTVLTLALASCENSNRRAPAIGEAYAGPSLLKIRRDIPLEAPVVATVKHGDRLELLQKRRRFFRVRTSSGVEGWTDERQLLAREDMDKLKELAARAARMPQQGQATTFSELNVHTLPYRQSPSFLQIRENEKVDVLEHVATPRIDVSEHKDLLPPKKAKPVPRKTKEAKYPPLASPLPPPGPPANWLELSKTNRDPAVEAEEQAKEEKPVAMDDWSLVRTKTGETGWVLTRRLVMAIPDEVAQYAEGHRIVSYFSLGEVPDGDQKKHDWLWTTIGDGSRPYDFDSFRVFIWSLHRHRYETAYIERNVRGYAPVVLKQVELANAKGTSTAKYPGFSVCLEKSDGQRWRREYAFLENVVRFAGEKPCEARSQESAAVQSATLRSSGEATAQPSAGRFAVLVERVRDRVRRWFRR